MNALMTSPFRPEELREARTEAMAEQINELRVFARRAKSPAKRVVLSELEERLLQMRAELEKAGLVNPSPELAA